jgi:hypothetical protein
MAFIVLMGSALLFMGGLLLILTYQYEKAKKQTT